MTSIWAILFCGNELFLEVVLFKTSQLVILLDNAKTLLPHPTPQPYYEGAILEFVVNQTSGCFLTADQYI